MQVRLYTQSQTEMVIQFVMGLAMIGIGAYAIYLTLAEQRRVNRPSAATRIMRALVGLVTLIIGVLAVLSGLGVSIKAPPHHF